MKLQWTKLKDDRYQGTTAGTTHTAEALELAKPGGAAANRWMAVHRAVLHVPGEDVPAARLWAGPARETRDLALRDLQEYTRPHLAPDSPPAATATCSPGQPSSTSSPSAAD